MASLLLKLRKYLQSSDSKIQTSAKRFTLKVFTNLHLLYFTIQNKPFQAIWYLPLFVLKLVAGIFAFPLLLLIFLARLFLVFLKDVKDTHKIRRALIQIGRPKISRNIMPKLDVPSDFFSANSFIYIHNFHPENVQQLINYNFIKERKRIAFIVRDRSLGKALEDWGHWVYAINEFSSEKHETKLDDVCLETECFIDRLIDTLRDSKYRGITIIELIKVRLTSEHRFLLHFITGYRTARRMGHDLIIFLVEKRDGISDMSLEIASKLGAYDLGIYKCYKYTLQGGLVKETKYLTDEAFIQTSDEEYFTELEFKKNLYSIHEKFAKSLLYSVSRFYMVFFKYMYPDCYLRKVTIPKLGARYASTGKRPVVVFTQANPDSVYWQALTPLLEEFKRRDYPLLLLTDNIDTAIACKKIGVQMRFIDWRLSRLLPHQHNKEVLEFYMKMMPLATKGLKSRENQSKDRKISPDESFFLHTLLSSKKYYDHFFHGLQYVEFLSEILPTLNPISILAFPHTHTISYASILVGKKLAIPTICMPATTVTGETRAISCWDMDLVAAYGSQCVDSFVQVGYPEEMLVVTGSTKMDPLNKINLSENRKKLAKKCEISFKKRILLVATSNADPNEFLWLNSLIAYCKRRGDCQVVVKAKHIYGKEFYSRVHEPLKSPYFRILEEKDCTLYPLLAVAEVVITDCSTAGAEAAMLQKPLVVVNLLGEPFPHNRYDEYGIALSITALDQLEDVMNRVLDDQETLNRFAKAREKIIWEFNYLNDGRASERVFNVLVNPDKYMKKVKKKGFPDCT